MVWENTVRGIRKPPRTSGNGPGVSNRRLEPSGHLSAFGDPLYFGAASTRWALPGKRGCAEVLCLPKAAVGTQVFYSKIYLETPSLFAWTIVVIILSLFLETLLTHLFGRMNRGGAGGRSGL